MNKPLTLLVVFIVLSMNVFGCRNSTSETQVDELAKIGKTVQRQNGIEKPKTADWIEFDGRLWTFHGTTYFYDYSNRGMDVNEYRSEEFGRRLLVAKVNEKVDRNKFYNQPLLIMSNQKFIDGRWLRDGETTIKRKHEIESISYEEGEQRGVTFTPIPVENR